MGTLKARIPVSLPFERASCRLFQPSSQVSGTLKAMLQGNFAESKGDIKFPEIDAVILEKVGALSFLTLPSTRNLLYFLPKYNRFSNTCITRLSTLVQLFAQLWIWIACISIHLTKYCKSHILYAYDSLTMRTFYSFLIVSPVSHWLRKRYTNTTVPIPDFKIEPELVSFHKF